MALAGALERLQEEAICPICLEYMSEPVSIDCGHNFCRGCIAKHCQEKGLWADGPFSCPQCRASCHRSGFRPNRQLANIVESIRQLGLRAGPGTEPGPGTPLCPQHDERLKLFCEEEEEAICVVCRESLHHRSHTVYPIEEAAQVYKVGEVGAPGGLCPAPMHPGHAGAGGNRPPGPQRPSPDSAGGTAGSAEEGWQRRRHPPSRSRRRDEAGPAGSQVAEAPRLSPARPGARSQPGSLPLRDTPAEGGVWVLSRGRVTSVEGCTQIPHPSDAPSSAPPTAPFPGTAGSSHSVLQNLNSEKNMGKPQGGRRGLTLRAE